MPARLAQVTIRNNTSFPLRWITDSDDTTTWQDPWFPSKLNGLPPGRQASFCSESSGGIMVGTEGSVVFEVGRFPTDQFPGPADELRISWDLPYIGDPSWDVKVVPRSNRDVSATAGVVGVRSMEHESKQEFGWEFLAALPTVIGRPYLLPFAWASEISLNSVEFLIEVRDVATVNLFPTNTPTPQEQPADVFRFMSLHPDGGAGSFPNFIDEKIGPNFMRGRIVVGTAGAEWRDVPLDELGTPVARGPVLVDQPNRFDRPPVADGPVLGGQTRTLDQPKLPFSRPSRIADATSRRISVGEPVQTVETSIVGGGSPIVPPGAVRSAGHDLHLRGRFTGQPSLDDFTGRMNATQRYADRNGFVGGFPTFLHADHGEGIVCGTVLIRQEAADWHDVPLSELGVTLDDIPGRFRATQQWASSRGYVGGFPNLVHQDYGAGMVCGTILLKPGWADRTQFLAAQDPR